MNFVLKLVYYCLLTLTTFLATYYLYAGIFKRYTGANPYHMKEWLAFSSLFVFLFLYKAYQAGEVSLRYQQGIYFIIVSWMMWGLVLLGFLILAKVQ